MTVDTPRSVARTSTSEWAERLVNGSSGTTVAVIEPDLLLRALLVRILLARGYVPVVLSSYTDLTDAEHAEVRIAIMDELPDTTFIEGARPPVPIVLLTNAHLKLTHEWWRVVVKPFSLEELLDALDTLALGADRPPNVR